MGRVMEEDNMRSPRRNRHQLIIKEVINVSEERTCKVEHAGSFDGELPLFFSTASKSSSRLDSNASELNTEVVNLKHVESGWPKGNHEIAAWASSFRFELDREGGEMLQAILLDEEAHISVKESNRDRKHTSSRDLTEDTSTGGSFRFIHGDQSGYLKPPRQLEKLHGSNRLTAVADEFANEKEGCVGAQSSDRLSMVQVGAARIKVPASPGRSEILRRLSDLKAHPLSPRFAPEDAVSYQKEVKMATVRNELHRRAKISLPLLKDEYSGKGSSSPASQYQCKTLKNALGELEIMSNIVERSRQSNSPSGVRGNPRRSAQLGSQEHPITPSRLRNGERQLVAGNSILEQIISIRKQSHAAASNGNNSPSPDHDVSVSAAIPFKWEEEPGKPKTIAAAAPYAQARRLSRDRIEVSNCIEMKSASQKDNFKPSTDEVESGNYGKGTEASTQSSSDIGNGDPVVRSGSYRYYGRAYLSKHSREGSLGRSSRRYSIQEKEAHIDLDASAASKFLVQAYESPSRSPGLLGSSPTNFAVPFKWEATPGRAKVKTTIRSPNLLQLPPRLAVPSYPSVENFSRELRASHPFSGFFAPCITASSPIYRKQSDHVLVEYTSSKSLPPKVPKRRKRHRFVGRCSSTPQEGCQIRVSKSFDDRASNHSSSEMPLIDHLSTTSLPIQKPRRLFVSELKNHANAPSSPTSILCGPDENSSQSSTSNIAFSSGDLEDFTRQTNHSRQSASKSSSSASYESIEEDFAELPSSEHTAPVPLPADSQHSGESRALLDKQAAPTSSGFLNIEIEPLSLKALPASQSVARQEINVSPQASPKRPTRLPYTMPSVAEQFLASCSTSGRRQLIQDLSPRLLHQYSGRRLSASHSGGSTPARVDRYLTSAPQASKAEQVSPSPAYAASLELFSPAVNAMARRKWCATPARTPLAKTPAAKPRRRFRFMLSICKTLKRVLGRQRRRKPIEPRLMYHGGKSPTATHQFKTTSS